LDSLKIFLRRVMKRRMIMEEGGEEQGLRAQLEDSEKIKEAFAETEDSQIHRGSNLISFLTCLTVS
jgi:type II secretory pathway component PulC